MIKRLKQYSLFCILLCGVIGLLGCDQQPSEDPSSTAVEYAVDNPFHQGPLRVRVRVSDEQALLSDLLTMELSAEIAADYEVQFPDVTKTLKEFDVHSRRDMSAEDSGNDKIIYIHRCQLEPLSLGMLEIPALTFTFKAKGSTDAEERSLTTEPIWIDIATSLPDDPNAFSIADIDDVVEVKSSNAWLWICLGVVCLLVIGVCFGMFLRPRKETQIRRIYKPAHEVAIAVLKAIAAENLVEQGRIKEFYEKLSGCLRQYIENRFQLRAPEQTTEEFLDHLKTSNVLKLEHKQQLQQFLEHCDLVKFARYQPSNDQINESLTIAEAFVEKTKSQEHLVDITEDAPAQGEGVS